MEEEEEEKRGGGETGEEEEGKGEGAEEEDPVIQKASQVETESWGPRQTGHPTSLLPGTGLCGSPRLTPATVYSPELGQLLPLASNKQNTER